MILLILSLPIYTSVALADFKVTSITGNDGVNGYRKTDDTTKITLKSDLPIVKIDNNALTCTGSGTNYTCSYIDRSIIDQPFIDYNFYNYDASNNAVGNKAPGGKIWVDNSNPKISAYTVLYNNGNVTLTATVGDLGYNYDSSTGCSGVKTIKFYDTTFIADYNTTLPNGSCQSTPITFVYPKPTGADRYHNFYFDAIDYLGQTASSEPIRLFIDTTAPEVTEAHLSFNGATLGYAPTGAVSGIRVNATITDHNLSITTPGAIKADLSNLNPSIGQAYKNIPFTCTLKSDSVYLCISQAFTLKVSNANPSIIFDMTDKNMINTTQSVTIPLEIDNAQISADISTPNCDEEGNCYFHSGKNSVIVSLTKNTAGAGFSSKRVYITPLNPSAVTSCKQNPDNANNWICINNISSLPPLADNQNLTLSINSSKDDIGNNVPTKDKDIIYDATSPALFGKVLFTKKSGIPYVQGKDMIEVNMWVKEKTSGVKSASANFKNIIRNGGGQTTSCSVDNTKGADIYKCTFSPDEQVISGYHANLSVDFNVTDYAGNTNKFSDKFTIYDTADNSTDFWEEDSKIIDPEFLDIRTSQYLPGRIPVWADVKLKPLENDIKLLNTGLKGGTCRPADATSANYLEKPLLFPPTATDDNPHVLISLEVSKTATLPEYVSNLTYICTLQLTTASNTKVYPVQELNVTVFVGLKDYGVDLPRDYKDRIEAFKEKLNDDKWITTLNKFFQTGQKVCNIVKALFNIYTIVQNLFDGVSVKCQGIPVYGLACARAMMTASNVQTGAAKVFTESYGTYICGFLDCSIADKLYGSFLPDGAVTFLNKYMSWYIASLTTSFDSLKNPTQLQGELKKTSSDPNILGTNAWQAAQKSIITSTLLLCVPGILYNIEKARQIDCRYVYCAETMTAGGFSPYTCDVMRANSYCNFVYGSMFHAIPFSGLVDAVGGVIKLFTTSPMAVVGGAIWVGCKFYPEAVGHQVCDIAGGVKEWVTFLSGTINTFKSIRSNTDYCSKVLDNPS